MKFKVLKFCLFLIENQNSDVVFSLLSVGEKPSQKAS